MVASRKRPRIPYYSGAARQRGQGLGTLALTVGRAALPILRNVILPSAKRLGKELLQQGTPELLDVVAGNIKPKQALKRTAKKTIRKQLGLGRPRKRRTTKRKTRKRIIRKRKRVQRSRADILGNLR